MYILKPAAIIQRRTRIGRAPHDNGRLWVNEMLATLHSGQSVAKSPVETLRSNIQTVFLGHSRAVDLLLIGLLAGGHVLIEDVPGVGKTVLAKALARSIDCRFSRVQLTPDLLPGDVLGVGIFNNLTQDF